MAIKVDRAKDAAISKLREAWLRLTGNLEKVEERHRAGLEKMMAEVENFKMVANEAQKVIYRILSLAKYLNNFPQLSSEYHVSLSFTLFLYKHEKRKKLYMKILHFY